MKKIYKYGTGDVVPEGAVFLSTIVEEQKALGGYVRFVWHYFLVEVDD